MVDGKKRVRYSIEDQESHWKELNEFWNIGEPLFDHCYEQKREIERLRQRNEILERQIRKVHLEIQEMLQEVAEVHIAEIGPPRKLRRSNARVWPRRRLIFE